MQTNKNMLFAVLKGVRRGIEYLFLGGENLDDALRRRYSYRRRLIDFNVLYADEIVSLQDKPSAELTLAEMPMMMSVDELLTAEKSDARLGDSKIARSRRLIDESAVINRHNDPHLAVGFHLDYLYHHKGE